VLRAHVGRGADHEPGLGQLLLAARAQRPRDPEVRHQRVAVVGEQQVFRLDVAMDYSVAVRVLQRLRCFARDP
jgi:hypothetical protein